MKVNGLVYEDKSSFKMPGLTLSSKFGWGSYIISIAKIASGKIGALICSLKCLSPEVALYLHKSAIYHTWNTCHVWFDAPSCSYFKKLVSVLL